MNATNANIFASNTSNAFMFNTLKITALPRTKLLSEKSSIVLNVSSSL